MPPADGFGIGSNDLVRLILGHREMLRFDIAARPLVAVFAAGDDCLDIDPVPGWIVQDQRRGMVGSRRTPGRTEHREYQRRKPHRRCPRTRIGRRPCFETRPSRPGSLINMRRWSCLIQKNLLFLRRLATQGLEDLRHSSRSTAILPRLIPLHGWNPQLICGNGVAQGGLASRSAADDRARQTACEKFASCQFVAANEPGPNGLAKPRACTVTGANKTAMTPVCSASSSL